jgi:protein subunit release factor B
MSSLKYGVSAAKEKYLLDKMKRLGIKESDILEHFIRAKGPGGQKVNKTSSCVYLKYKPTGIEVKCAQERTQSLNRFLARRILVEKIEARILGKKSQEQKRIYKIKKQKKKRSKRAKEKILRQKHLQSEKKQLRKPPIPEEQ